MKKIQIKQRQITVDDIQSVTVTTEGSKVKIATARGTSGYIGGDSIIAFDAESRSWIINPVPWENLRAERLEQDGKKTSLIALTKHRGFDFHIPNWLTLEEVEMDFYVLFDIERRQFKEAYLQLNETVPSTYIRLTQAIMTKLKADSLVKRADGVFGFLDVSGRPIDAENEK